MDEDLSYRDTAIRALGADRHDTAADSYARAAYAELAGLQGRRRDVYDPETATWVGYPLGAFFLAAVCHRVDGADDRARNRAGQGIMVAGDHRDHLLDDPVAEAACHEWVGDFRTVAGDDDKARAAYDRAESGYEEAAPDDPVSWTTEPLLQAGTDTVLQLSRPDDVQWDDLHGSAPQQALTHRVRFKRSRLASMVAKRVDDGKLHAPRGSTEYGVGQFKCPDCGSSDVNYVADTVLCLRCDTPVDGR
ncbi:hypothetical protein SAMN04487949_1965 [Halogranum gelatinilyticum]|uniref:Uncharacterized protein n=1 Tax=Halogranum gelatinilyticum TaxID=660521 RepID=A0A1G9TYM7_9EURY|nr:hypothetical protein [Halogranum gelatinilyticum]SDM52701.1 hypothetical protein SAMN04487949_1965 [Halogranum gelatinilyticum]